VVNAAPTRRELFDPLVALAKSRVLELADANVLALDDAGFLVRALFDLETDGVGLFGGDRPADDVFYTEVSNYLAARVGADPVRALALGPFDPAAVAALSPRTGLENAVAELVKHSEVNS
jgi:hypothetical protein